MNATVVSQSSLSLQVAHCSYNQPSTVAVGLLGSVNSLLVECLMRQHVHCSRYIQTKSSSFETTFLLGGWVSKASNRTLSRPTVQTIKDPSLRGLLLQLRPLSFHETAWNIHYSHAGLTQAIKRRLFFPYSCNSYIR